MKNSNFDENFIKSQKEKLELEKQGIEERLKSRTKYQDYGDDIESNAQEFAQAETNANVADDLEEELKLVEKALLNIKEGKYGLDVNTGEPIDKKRLEAYPAAQKSV